MNQMLSVAEAAQDYRARFTTREFLAMCEAGAFAGMKVELVRGELERMNFPRADHSRIQTQLMVKLAALVGGDRHVMALGEIGIDLGGNTVLGGDAVLARRMEENRWLRPDEVILLVEVAVTTRARDLGMKLREYAGAGIPNYWVADAKARLVHRFTEPAGGEYRTLEPVPFGEPWPVPGTDGTIVLDC